MQWFRYYHEALDDPKVQRCSSDAFRCWVNLLCVACRCSGKIPPLDDVAFILRVEPKRLAELLSELDGLVSIRGDKITITNWDKRQYRSDNSTERSRKHRQKKTVSETDTQRTRNVAVTPPDTDTESDTEKKKEVRATRSAPAKGTRIPEGFPGQKEIDHALSEGWPHQKAEREAAQFRDHFLAVAGQKGVKLDWPATWRTWVRRDLNGSGPKQSQSDKDDAAFREAARRIGANQ